MSRATELADGLLSFAAMLPAYGFDPTHLIKSEAELRRLDRVNAELVEALRAVHDRLSICAGLPMYAEEVYDSFYRDIVEAALTSATKETT